MMVVSPLHAFRPGGHDGRSRPGVARLRVEFDLPGDGCGLGRVGPIPLGGEVAKRDLARPDRDFQVATFGLELGDARTAVEVEARLFRRIRFERDDPDRLSTELGAKPDRGLFRQRHATLQPRLGDRMLGPQRVAFSDRLSLRDRRLQPCARVSELPRPPRRDRHQHDRRQRGDEESDCEIERRLDHPSPVPELKPQFIFAQGRAAA